MKAITVIESEDGSLTVTRSGGPTDVESGVELLHRGIDALVRFQFDTKEDHAEQ